MKHFIVITISFFAIWGWSKTKSHSAPKPMVWCENKLLPSNLPSKKTELKVMFDQTDRKTLIQSFWGELLQEQPRKILIPVIQYLAQSEPNPSVTGYYQAMAVAAGIQRPVDIEIEAWPQHSSNPHKVKANLKELCDLYSRAGGDDFNRK